jgi:phage gp29-like protein
MSNRLSEIKSALTPARRNIVTPDIINPAAKNLGNYITPVQLQRMAQDVGTWRRAINEAEQAYFPHRVRMQQLYIDTILNGHVFSVMERRKDLTLLRDFQICKGETESPELTQMFQAEWFSLFMAYALDALFFGYSLISLGDVTDNEFNDLSIVKRWNISPDRLNVGSFMYHNSGLSFMEAPYKDWHVWVPTPSETGQSPCGYGLFYKIGLYEIFLRNTLGFNGDFVELYSQPYRVGKTTKTNEAERAELENALRNMGSSGYAIIDPTDEITFLETALAGTGWKGYENLEQRCEKKVSKIVLGHADALDSVPGKLGAGSGDDNPVMIALTDKQTKDGRFIQSLVNKELIPRMRNMGFSIPEGYVFKFKNDQEIQEYRKREDESNAKTAEIAQTMKNAGLKMDAKYFEKRTGIPTAEAEVPAPLAPVEDPLKKDNKKELSNRIKNKLDNLYK